jgi:hypothetical protein
MIAIRDERLDDPADRLISRVSVYEGTVYA